MQAEFDAIVARHRRDVERLVKRLKSGAIDADQFGDGLDAIVWKGHSDAVTLGRRAAGDRRRQTDADQLLGLDIKDREAEWLNPFVDDLRSGKYLLEDGSLNYARIERRANMYSVKYRATCTEAVLDGSAPGELWLWRLGPTEHCDDCRMLSLAGPLTRNELWTVPGASETACVLGCRCWLERASDGFSLPKHAQVGASAGAS